MLISNAGNELLRTRCQSSVSSHPRAISSPFSDVSSGGAFFSGTLAQGVRRLNQECGISVSPHFRGSAGRGPWSPLLGFGFGFGFGIPQGREFPLRQLSPTLVFWQVFSVMSGGRTAVFFPTSDVRKGWRGATLLRISPPPAPLGKQFGRSRLDL